jgi:hypothetical protein
MNYQAIASVIEVAFSNAFALVTPRPDVFFDNVTAIPPDPPEEYIRINIVFGTMTESTLTESLDNANGIIVVRFYTKKDTGPLRSRQLAGVAFSVLKSLGSTAKPSTGIFLRTQGIRGPTFPQNEEIPYYFARMEASWHATEIC